MIVLKNWDVIKWTIDDTKKEYVVIKALGRWWAIGYTPEIHDLANSSWSIASYSQQDVKEHLEDGTIVIVGHAWVLDEQEIDKCEK